MNKVFSILIPVIALNACTWVHLDPEAEKTRVASASDVKNCKKLGKTTASLADSVAGFERNPDKVQEELKILARNSAVGLGGDTVVPLGVPEDGKQVFEVYRCINP